MAWDGRTRRRFLRSTAGTVLGAGLLARTESVTATQQSAEQWTQFGYDTANTGHAPENTGPSGDIREQWAFQTGNGVGSPPVVADGTVYVGSDDENVYALDAQDGSEQWAFQTGGIVWSSPAVADGTVYIGSDDDTVYALDASDGSQQWAFQTGNGVGSSPAVADGTVYIGSDDDTVYALDASDGSQQWAFQTGDYVFSSPAVTDGTVYVGSWDENVYALDASDGSEQWAYETGDWVTSSPAVVDGTVYVGSGDETVYALDAQDGSEQWAFQTGGSVWSSPAVAGGTVYVGSYDENVYALDASDGSEQWAFQTGDEVRSSPAVADGTVYIGSFDSAVYALTGETPSPERTPTAEDTPSPEPPLTPGESRSPEPTPTETPLRSSPTESTNGDQDGMGLAPVLVALGLVGAGGAGGWWYMRDDDTDQDDSGGSGPATRPTGPGSTGSTQSDTSTTESASPAGAASTETPASDTSTTNESNDTTVVRMDTDSVPERVPRAPDVSVDYDALTDEEPIGGGGNADVTRAILPTPDGDVTLAIKKPRMNGTLHSEQVERMLDEAETWDRLDDHDHVVGVVDYGSDPLPWIAMEYMDGGHLGARSGELALDQALWTAIAITKGVRHAHTRGVAHLDLKPENILFREVDGAWDAPKVADWGLSKHLLDHSKSVEGMSPHYAAPEQFEREYGPTDNVTDVYQLGAVCYELFTGQPPFEGRPTQVMRDVMDRQPTPPSEVADVPAELDEIVLTALAKEKADRYDDVILLRNALRDVSGEW